METYTLDFSAEMDCFIAIPDNASEFDAGAAYTLPGNTEYEARSFALRTGMTLSN